MRDVSFAWGGDPPTLLDLLVGRQSSRGLTEHEAWALLCQAVQALQDLFLSDSVSCKQCLPLVTPATLELSSRGRVRLKLVWVAADSEHRRPDGGVGYLAPEYRHGRKCTDTDNEKMWIFSLGETLKRATVTSNISTELCQVLAHMTRNHISTRASLMYLLDVISQYCNRLQKGRPFSHAIMDLHQEAMAAMEAAQEESENRGPPAMPHLKLRTPKTNRYDQALEPLLPPLAGGVPCRWRDLQSPVRGSARKLATSMEDVRAAHWRRGDTNHRHHQDRPKSICVPPGRYEWDQWRASKLDGQGERMEHDELSHPAPYDRALCSPTIPVPRPLLRRRVRGVALQRAASRLYRVEDATPHLGGAKTNNGPEFVLKAAQPVANVTLGEGRATAVTVILLDGRRVEVNCDMNRTTAGQLFEAIVQYEHLEDNFMLGLSALIAGDFVFLLSDTRLSKAFSSDGSNQSPLLFVRVRFFLPKGCDRSSHAQHALYLQVRRSLLEHQLPCPFRKVVELAGLALQAEFGDFTEKEHGSRDYFVLEHYVPETMSCVTKDTDRMKMELIDAHISKKGLSREKAEQMFVCLAQSLPHYGGHFYTAIWVLKSNAISHYPIRQLEQRPVWLRVSAEGIGLYERGASTTAFPGGPVAYAQFEWRAIRTLCYSKRYLCVLPHRGEDEEQKLLKKYKLRMEHSKSYFAFRLASLHHQFFLRLRTENDSLSSLSRQFGVPLKSIKDDANSLRRVQSASRNDRQDVNAGTEFDVQYRTSSSTVEPKIALWLSKSIEDCKRFDESINEDRQNRENECPNQDKFSSLQSTESKGYSEKRRGVKMGVNAVRGGRDAEFGVLRTARSVEALTGNTEMFTKNDEERLLRLSGCSSATTARMAAVDDEAFVLDCSMSSRSPSDNVTPLCPFELKTEETLGDSLIARLQGASYIDGERRLTAVRLLRRGSDRELGIRIAAGEDGGAYIAAVKLQQADVRDIGPGDQVVAVNGISLLGVQYERAVQLLLEACGEEVELVIATERPSIHTESPSLDGESNSGSRYSAKEKHATEDCRDVDNFKKHPPTPPLSVPYHKHIRYEIETDLHCAEDITTLVKEPMKDMKIEETSHRPLTKIFSKSCSNLTQSNARNTAVVVDMIKKEHTEHAARSLDNKKTEDFTKVAVPRTLGTGRKWRGPVRYPVTPVRKMPTEAGSPVTTEEYRVHFHDGLRDYSSVSSEDEQIFI